MTRSGPSHVRLILLGNTVLGVHFLLARVDAIGHIADGCSFDRGEIEALAGGMNE